MNSIAIAYVPEPLRSLIAKEMKEALGDQSHLRLIVQHPPDPSGDCQQYRDLREHVIADPEVQSPILVAHWERSVACDWMSHTAPWAQRFRLPVTRRELRERIISATERQPTPKEWEEFVDLSFHTVLENEASIVRHSFKGIVAVVRLYIGSLIFGISAVDHADTVFDQLRERARMQANELESKRIASLISLVETYAKWLKQHHGALEASPNSRTRRRLARRFLMLDDQVSDFGWDLLFREILPSNGSFVGFGTPVASIWRTFQERLTDSQAAKTTILLDCNLGKREPTGLKILNAIRPAYPEIPIVFLTAFDDAELALWALRAGANRFFAKQLHDSGNRSSERYFEHFLDQIDVGDSFEDIRRLWVKYARVRDITGFSEEYVKRQRKCFEPESEEASVIQAREFFDFAFYLLFSYADGFRHWGLWPEDRAKREAALIQQVFVCIDQALPRKSRATRSWRHDVSAEGTQSLMPVISLLGTRIGQDLIGEECKLPRPSFELPKGCPYLEEDLRVEGDTPGVEFGGRPSHEERSARAATELRQGFRNLRSGDRPHVSYQDIAVIDDRGNNGWFDAFLSKWPKCRTHKSLQEMLSISDLKKCNCLVLNLHLPGVEEGLEALRMVKRLSPGLPILIASATSDAPGVLKAMRSGAIDFIAKSLPRALKEEEYERFAQSVSDKVEAARILGDSNSRRWLDRACDWLSQTHPVSDRHKNAMKRVNQNAHKRPNADMFEFPESQDWTEAVGDAIRLFGFSYYQSCLIRISRDEEFKVLAPADVWRIRWFLPVDDGTVLRRLVMMASQIVEELARMAWALEKGRSFRQSDWGAPEECRTAIRIGQTVGTLGDPAGQIWQLRNKGGGSPDGVADALWSSILRFGKKMEGSK